MKVWMRIHAVYGFLVGQMTHQMKADNPGNLEIYFCETFSFILAFLKKMRRQVYFDKTRQLLTFDHDFSPCVYHGIDGSDGMNCKWK